MFQIPRLENFKNLIHGFSTVDEGNMSFRYGSKQQVVGSRGKFLNEMKIKMEDCVVMWVEHGERILVAGKCDLGRGVLDIESAHRVDAMITGENNLFLVLLIADCLPVTIFDPKKKVVGVVHIGWKNADMNLARKVIRRLEDQYEVKTSDLVIGFGPAIRKDSYIQKNPSQLSDPKWKGFVRKIEHQGHSGVKRSEAIESFTEQSRSYRSFHFLQDDSNANLYSIDLVGLCRKQLIDAGVIGKNIFDCGIDTVKDKRFFSHYRDKGSGVEDQGRFGCIVGFR